MDKGYYPIFMEKDVMKYELKPKKFKIYSHARVPFSSLSPEPPRALLLTINSNEHWENEKAERKKEERGCR